MSNNFGKYFSCTIYGMLAILTLIFFILAKVWNQIFLAIIFLYKFRSLQTNVFDEPNIFIHGAICLATILIQFGSFCFFGQRLITSSAELLDASYECKWYEQTKSFKQTLIILRYVCQRELSLGVEDFMFSHESFYRVTTLKWNS